MGDGAPLNILSVPFNSGSPAIVKGGNAKVVFGNGTRFHIDRELAALGINRTLLITTPGRLPVMSELMRDTAFGGAIEVNEGHVSEAQIRTGMEKVDKLKVDGLLAVGGGAPLGLSKALARRTGLKQMFVPTTYAGSEMTATVGETSNGRKRLFHDPVMRAATILYDPLLTHSLPIAMTVASGFNAMAHAVGVLANDGGSETDNDAVEGLALMRVSLETLVIAPRSAEARESALRAAQLCGRGISHMRFRVHHQLCHALGGIADLSNANCHAILLPYSLSALRDLRPISFARVVRPPLSQLPELLQTLAWTAGVPRSLQAIGCSQSDANDASEQLVVSAAEAGLDTAFTRAWIENVLPAAMIGKKI